VRRKKEEIFMADFSVVFRGIVAAVDQGKTKPVRFLLPNGYDPTMAGPSPDTMIPRHLGYLAVPEEALTSGNEPDLTCHLFGHPPRNLSGRFAIFWIRGEVQIDHDVTKSSTKGIATAKSCVPHMRDIKKASAKVAPAFLGSTPPDDCRAFVDLWTRGIDEVTDNTHVYEFIYGDATWGKDLAHEVVAHIRTPTDTVSLSFRRLHKKRKEKLSIDSTIAAAVLIGNEMPDDILAIGSPRPCAEPAYHYQLLFKLSETPPDCHYSPAPVCTAHMGAYARNGQHPRDRPETICIPPTFMEA
jgi:hypothetical protein